MGERIGQRRVQLRLAQEKAAALAGISRESWAKVEAGLNENPRRSTTEGICTALRWTPESIELILQGKEPVEIPPGGAAEIADLTGRVDLLEDAVGRVVSDLREIRAMLEGRGPQPPTR